MEKRVAVYNNNTGVIETMSSLLAGEGLKMVAVTGRAQLQELLRAQEIQLLLLDVELDGRGWGEGIEMIHDIRNMTSIPIIIISAQDAETAKIMALNAGADDYVTKPFGSNEFLARIRSTLRMTTHRMQNGMFPGGKFEASGLTIDYDARRVFLHKKEVKLTQTEYNIIAALSEHAGKVMTYSAIIKEIWGYNDEGSIKKLQVNMVNIRKKLGARPGEKNYIVNELGVGYRMCEADEETL